MNVFELSAMLILNKEAYDRGLKDAESSANNSKIGDVVGKIGTAVKTGFLAAGAAATKFATDSIQTGMEFDTAMSQVAATMGYTVADLNTAGSEAQKAYESLRETAEYYGKTTAFTATQAAEALNYMALAGWDVETSISELPTVLNLAAAGSMDLAAASDMVTDASSALGLDLHETNLMVDQMAKAASSSNTSVSQLGEAYLTVGATARDMAGGTLEMSSVLGVLADNGIKGSEAGTHLRNILLRLNPSTKESANAWKLLGISAYDSYGRLRPLKDTLADLREALKDMSDQDRSTFITAMFKETDLAAVNALLNTSAERFDELDNKIASAWYTNESLRQSLNDQGLSLEDMAQKVKALGIGVGDFNYYLGRSGGSAEEFAEALLEWADDGVTYEQVVEALGGDLDNLDIAFSNVQGAAEAMAETQLDNLQGDMIKLSSATEGLRIAFSELSDGPLRTFVQFFTEGISQITEGLKEGGITGAFQAFVDVFGMGMSQLGDGLMSFTTKALNELPNALSNAASIGGQMFTTIFNGLMTAIPQFASAGAAALNQIASGLSTAIPNLLAMVLPMLQSLTENIRTNAGVLIDAGINLILQLVQGLMNGLPELIAYVPDIVINICGVINDNAPKLIIAAGKLILMIIQGLIEALPSLLANFGKIIEMLIAMWDAINWLNLGTKVIEFIANGIKSLATKVPQLLKSIGTTAHDALKNIKWLELGKSVIDFIKNGLQQLFKSIPDKLKEIGKSAFDAFKNINWLDLGKNIVNGIIDGIGLMASKLFETLENLASNALTKAKEFLGIESPSKEFRDKVGKFIPMGIGVGIEKNANSVYDSLDGVLGEATKQARNYSISPIDAVMSATAGIRAAAQPYIIYLNNVMELDGKVVASTANEVLGAMV